MPPLADAQQWNWEVLWVAKGRRQRKDFGHDIAGARELENKLLRAGRKDVTLRCKNYGFPPPEKYQPYHVIVRRGKKRFRATRVPMKALNLRGIFWCPYCMKLRRFKTVSGFVLEGIRMEEKRHICPVCHINVSDRHVKIHNPLAGRIEYDLRGRSGKKKGRSRNRRRRTRGDR